MANDFKVKNGLILASGTLTAGGSVGTAGQVLSSTGTGVQWITATAVDNTKLPLAGGTMTGAITFAAGQTWPTFNQSTTGNAATATTLQTARTINGTSFNGSAAITTANWGTARTVTIGATGKSVNGSAAVSWTLAEIGAATSAQGTNADNALAGGHYGQTWQDVKTTPGRALATTYTNATGKPIMVAVSAHSSNSSAFGIVQVDGVNRMFTSQSFAVSGAVQAVFIVPNGSTYRVNQNVGTIVLDWWNELR